VNNQVKRNYLEIKSIDDLARVDRPFNDLYIDKIYPPDFQLNKFFYKEIGKKHRWIDKLVWSNQNWIEYLNKKVTNTYILKQKSELVGYFEQIFYQDKLDCEIAYFGILEEYQNKKLGSFLLSEAIKKSFASNTKRVWVHTCSSDHKNALNNYISRGMKIFKTETLKI